MATSGSYDWNLTRDDIIKAALRLCSVIGQDGTPTVNQYTNASVALNALIKAWRSKENFLWAVDWITLTLTASAVVVGTDGNDYECIRNHTSAAANKPVTGANYTTYWKATGGTGSGSVWATATAYTSVCNIALDSEYIGVNTGFVRRSMTDTPLTPLTEEGYMELGNKTITGLPSSYWFKRGRDNSEVFLFSFPENTTDVIHLAAVRQIQDFDDSADDPDFPAEWLRALKFNLAVDLAPEYDVKSGKRDRLERDAAIFLAEASGGDQQTGDLQMSPDMR